MIQPSRARLEEAIAGAIHYLYRNQLPYGEFKTYASKDKHLKRNCRFDSSPFVTAWVVNCIGHWQDLQVREITERAIEFLLSEMEGPGVWRYWSSRNKNHQFLPPDVDDTCCISYVLEDQRERFSPNRELILLNRNSEDLFYTWMVPRPDTLKPAVEALETLIDPSARSLWSISGILDNVDPAVNANVLLYLGENTETRPTISYLIDIIRGQRTGTGISFYPEPLMFYYLISRAYASGIRALVETQALITKRVLAMQDRSGSFGNELLTACGICTLLNFKQYDPELGRAVQYLLQQQTQQGAWRRIAAFLGPAPYYGSEELTTALCIQALGSYFYSLD